MVAQPVTQAVAQYRAAMAQIRAGDAAIAARVHADDQAFGTIPAKRTTGESPAQPLSGSFANAAKETNLFKIRP